MKNVAQVLLLITLSSLCSLVIAADLYTDGELEAIEGVGVHLGDPSEDARLAIADFLSIKPERVRETLGSKYPELVEYYVLHLKYDDRRAPYRIDVGLTIDLDREESGYVVVQSVRINASHAKAQSETQKVIDSAVKKTLETVGPATFVKDVDGTTTYFWCSKLNRNNDSCDNKFAMARMGHRLELTNPKYREKFGEYLQEKQAQQK